MKISLIHPSRSRPQKAHECKYNWISKASHKASIEHIISIDENDPLKQQYLDRFEFGGVIVKSNKSVVDATNEAAKVATGDILIYLSDDFDCPHNWDVLVAESISLEKPELIKVDDCLQPFNVKVLTIPIMNRKLYDKLGYFWHPDYKSMFVDEDLYHTCANNGWMKMCPELKFEHKHACVGKAENDNTYIRSSANWDQGKEAFRKRQLAGFPL